jgi:hypothetical protein
MESRAYASNKHTEDRRSQLQVWKLVGSLGAVGWACSLLLRRTLLLCVSRPGRCACANSRGLGSGMVHCSVVREAQRERCGIGYLGRCETGCRNRPRDVWQAIRGHLLSIRLSGRPWSSAGERGPDGGGMGQKTVRDRETTLTPLLIEDLRRRPRVGGRDAERDRRCG